MMCTIDHVFSKDFYWRFFIQLFIGPIITQGHADGCLFYPAAKRLFFNSVFKFGKDRYGRERIRSFFLLIL